MASVPLSDKFQDIKILIAENVKIKLWAIVGGPYVPMTDCDRWLIKGFMHCKANQPLCTS